MDKKYILNKKAFFFDLDGTVVDSFELAYQCLKPAFSLHLQIDLSREEFARDIFGRSVRRDLIEIKKIGEARAEKVIDYYYMLKEEALRNKWNKYLKLMPGVVVFLKYLRKLKKRIFITSLASHTNISLILSNLYIENYFDKVLGSEDVIHGKPDPEIYHLAVKLSEELPENCIVFEDSPNGIRAAINADLEIIAFKSGVSSIPQSKNIIMQISDYTELLV